MRLDVYNASFILLLLHLFIFIPRIVGCSSLYALILYSSPRDSVFKSRFRHGGLICNDLESLIYRLHGPV